MNRKRDFTEMLAAARQNMGKPISSQDLFRSTKKHSPFTQSAHGLLREIHAMRTNMINAKSDYLDLRRHLSGPATGMGDDERKIFEHTIVQFVKDTDTALTTMRSKIEAQPASNVKAFSLSVISILDHRLKELMDTYSKLTIARTQSKRKEMSSSFNRGPVAVPVTLADDEQENPTVARISAEEKALLQQESEALLSEFRDSMEEMRRTEQKMIEISQLTERLAMKVAEQEEITDSIYDKAVEASSNVAVGNQYLGQALQRGVDFRVMIMLILVGASFSLLFLDAIYD